jgi:hypothetical protein
MAESTQLKDQIKVQPAQVPAAGASPGVWAKIKLVIHRAFFWSYERGSWQYDVIVAAILAFIFLTPRSWYQRDPNLGMVDLRHVQGVVEVAHEKSHHTYVMDARLLQSRSHQAPEAAARDILQERLGMQFRVLSVEPVRDEAGVILSYKVVVEQKSAAPAGN